MNDLSVSHAAVGGISGAISSIITWITMRDKVETKYCEKVHETNSILCDTKHIAMDNALKSIDVKLDLLIEHTLGKKK